MKAYYYILVLVLIFLSIPNTAEAQDKNSKSSIDLLVGTWTFNYNDSQKKIEKSTKSKFDSLTKQQRTAMEAIYKDRQITFGNDGNFVLTLADGRKFTGTWKLNDKEKAIDITAPNGNVFTQNIKKLTVTELVLKLKVQEM